MDYLPATSDFVKIEIHLLDLAAPEGLVIEVILIPLHLSPAQDAAAQKCYGGYYYALCLTRSPQRQVVGTGSPDSSEEIPVEWTEAYLIPLDPIFQAVTGLLVKRTVSVTYRRIGSFYCREIEGCSTEIIPSTKRQSHHTSLKDMVVCSVTSSRSRVTVLLVAMRGQTEKKAVMFSDRLHSRAIRFDTL